MAEVKPAARSRLRSDLGILGFVGGSHFFAHFYVLVLPPIFPLLARDLGVGYAALGFLLALSNVTTSVVQVPVGFLVDRFGARPLLVAGLILMGGGVTAMGLFPNYEAMAVFSIVVGLGNAVFHPADYAVLSSRISPARMGRAFSLHTFAGHLGWVVAPALVVGLTGLVSWQFALALLGSLGIVMALNVFLRGRSLDDDGTECASTAPHATKPAGLGDWRIIVWPPMLLLFVYMVFQALASNGLNGFVVAAIDSQFAVGLGEANVALTGFLIAGACGVLVGGQLADMTDRHDLVLVVGFVVGAAALLVAGNGSAGFGTTIAAVAFAGLLLGAVRPSRDMIVRKVTPPGAYGRVFGFVTMGMNIGAACSPPLFGWLLDKGHTGALYYFAALAMVLALVAALAGNALALRMAPKSGKV